MIALSQFENAPPILQGRVADVDSLADLAFHWLMVTATPHTEFAKEILQTLDLPPVPLSTGLVIDVSSSSSLATDAPAVVTREDVCGSCALHGLGEL